MIEEIRPYQEGDFVKRSDREIDYHGPVYNVTYPAECEGVTEMMGWEGSGYRVKLGFGFPDGTFTLNVLGDIPEWVQDRFKEHKVTLELSKKRGEGDPIRL